MSRDSSQRRIYLGASLVLLALFVVASFFAPEFLSPANMDQMAKGPSEVPPLGTDMMGIPLTEYALQGTRIVAIPSLISGMVVALFAILAGLSRCSDLAWTDSALQVFSELVGALPRMVVVLVVAMLLPRDARSLAPIGITWAVLAAPGAMDEAAATAGRLGGASFVEALRAHGFSAFRIYIYHIVWLNLRSVIVRQAAEVAMQVVFLEIALSYLAAFMQQPSFTHSDSTHSWASLLYMGYTGLISPTGMLHALWIGLGLVALVALMAQGFRLSARSR